jgi:hypothetical protein
MEFLAVLTATWATMTSPLVVPGGTLRVRDVLLPPVVFADDDLREMPGGGVGVGALAGLRAMSCVTFE